MSIPSRGELLHRARAMRRQPTDAEQRLWLLLRDRRLAGFEFHRQVPLGGFVVDFLCHQARLVVEVDGGQHAECSSDIARDQWLASNCYRVVRYWNNDVLEDPEGVLLDLLRHLH